MSPGKSLSEPRPRIAIITQRLAADTGRVIHDARLRRAWRLADLAAKADVSVSLAHAVEAGHVASLGTYVRLADALGLEPRLVLDSKKAARPVADGDPVHAAMGDVEAAHLAATGYEVLLDEPYQHYQFAGRADVVAISRERRALLHIENRTRFPDIQSFVGSYNAKRAYLADRLAERLGMRGGFDVIDNVVVALWSSEVLHTLRLRTASFKAVCPDPIDRFEAWWSGAMVVGPERPHERVRSAGRVTSSSLVVFDPLTGRRSSRRRWIGLPEVRRADPRYRGYAAALEALRTAAMA